MRVEDQVRQTKSNTIPLIIVDKVWSVLYNLCGGSLIKAYIPMRVVCENPTHRSIL